MGSDTSRFNLDVDQNTYLNLDGTDNDKTNMQEMQPIRLVTS